MTRIPSPPKRLLAVAACAAALVVAGCGGDDEEPEGAPIPQAQAQELEARLDEVQRRFDFGGGACGDIQDDSRPGVDQILATIPNRVDADVRQALADGFDRLFQLSQEQCEGEETETTEEPVETVPAETETVEVPTTPTETVPPDTDTTEQPTTPVEPPGNGNGNGNGNGPDGTGPPGQGDGGGVIVPEDGEE
jgi:hypothetical protein